MLATPTPKGIEEEIRRYRQRRFLNLSFSEPLEAQFDHDTAPDRCYRLWLEGLLAIIFLNGCLLIDYVLVEDPTWKSLVVRTMIVTPLALVVNYLVRISPRRVIREGSVALGTTLICYINLYIEGNATAASTTYGLICVLIAVLFADVVMRIRLPYAASATAAMLVGAGWFLIRSTALQSSERIIATSLLAIGVAITLTASYSLEREERLGYLLHLRSQVQGLELAALNSELKQLSIVDTLTGLPNRRAFEDRFEELWAESGRLDKPLSAIILDVDHFKALNDGHGHLHGDKVLQHIGSLLLQGLQPDRDFAARFGGEEFVVLLPDSGMERALLVAEQIRDLVERSGTLTSEGTLPDSLLWPTISCGVATCMPGSGLYRDDLLKAADRALYQAKAEGRNRVSPQVVVVESGVL